MRNFFLFGLALALVFFGAVVLSHVPRGLTAPSDVGMGRVAKLTSFESTDSKAVKESGIRMEIIKLTQYLVLPIPEKRLNLGYPLPLIVRITNNTPTPIQAGYETLTPELVGPDGQALPLQKAKNKRSETRKPICQLVEPGDEVNLIPASKLSWVNNKLQLENVGGLGSIGYFDALKPGIYQLRFTYDSPGGTVSCLEPKTGELRRVEGLGTGRGVTTFVPLRVVKPVAINSTTVEMDGFWYETVVPQRVLPIPANKPDVKTPVLVGIRITNKTSTPRFFSYFDKLLPSIVEPDGKSPSWEGGRADSAISGCESVQPEESVTFFWDAKLFWENNKLQLEGHDRFGTYWKFDALKPGKYQIGVNYYYLPSPLPCDSKADPSDPWRLLRLPPSLGVNPPVEVHLVQGSDT